MAKDLPNGCKNEKSVSLRRYHKRREAETFGCLDALAWVILFIVVFTIISWILCC